MKLVNDFIVPPKTPGFTLPGNTVSDWKMEWLIKTEYPARSFKANGTAHMQISLTANKPLNASTPHSLQVDISKAGTNNTAQIINGYDVSNISNAVDLPDTIVTRRWYGIELQGCR